VGDYDAYVSLRIVDQNGTILSAASARDNTGNGYISIESLVYGTTPDSTYTATGFGGRDVLSKGIGEQAQMKKAGHEKTATRLLPIFCVLITLSAGLAQTNPVTPKGKDPSVRTVEELLQQPSGFSSGFSDKQSDRLGDRVSISLLKIFNANELEDPENIRKFLPIVRSSFLYPNLIPTQYRKPRVTLPLLARLTRRVADVKLKSEILAVAGFVKEQTRPNRYQQ